MARNWPPKILVVDNYDSFVYTIVGYLEHMGASCQVLRNDEVPVDEFNEPDISSFDGVLISPGPGNPSSAGQTLAVIAKCAKTSTPMFGVCLGLQALAQHFGATISYAPELMHGKTAEISHNSSSVFAHLPSPLVATRYHSLAVVPETIGAELEVTATAADGSVQGLSHRELPLHAVQFHPESVLTEYGYQMLAFFLDLAAGSDGSRAREIAKDLKPLVEI